MKININCVKHIILEERAMLQNQKEIQHEIQNADKIFNVLKCGWFLREICHVNLSQK